MLPSLVLGLALGATAAPSTPILSRQAAVQDALLLIGGGSATGSILAATFDGTAFTVVANDTRAGTGPSWLLFKEPNLLFAVDENSNNTRLFNFDIATNVFTLVQNVPSSRGLVHLEFSGRKDFIVGSAFGQGTIDVFSVDATDGALSLLKTIVSDDALGPNAARQDAPHPHQAVLDNSARFFAVNDLGTDTILIIDSLNGAFDVVNRVRVPNAGCGPRHGAWFPPLSAGSDFPTNYILACELTNELVVFALEYQASNISFTPVQTISTFGPGLGAANASQATAGELVVSSDKKSVFVSNRNTGNETDFVSVFSVAGAQGSSGDRVRLAFQASVSSGGNVPRMFSLSAQQDLLFVANQDGASALQALPRVAETGELGIQAAAVLAIETFGVLGANSGPQFVQQIQ